MRGKYNQFKLSDYGTTIVLLFQKDEMQRFVLVNTCTITVEAGVKVK